MWFALLMFVFFGNFCFAEDTQITQTPEPDYSAATDEELAVVDGVPFAPPQSRASNVDVGQGQNKCRTFTGQGGLNPGLIDVITLYSQPVYDRYNRLTEHQSVTLNNKDFVPSGSVISHDTVVKLHCRGVTMAMFQETPESEPIPVKEYYARCNNGYFYTCKLDEKMHDPSMDKYYVKYTGNAKECLTSKKTPVFPCRPGCDVTRFVDSNRYSISAETFDFKDPIGYDFEGNIIEIIYKQILPMDSVTVSCINGTFLATSATGMEKTFEMSCDKNGVVTFPDDRDSTKNSTCVDTKACIIPNDTIEQQWGVYRAGNFIRPANNIPHNGYISVRCGNYENNDERTILCVNGNYFPSVVNACKGDLYIEEGSDA